MLADIYLRGDQWRFRAIGQGYDHGLAYFAIEHGVDVD
jgi:DNA polymerase-3 subunit epsilon